MFDNLDPSKAKLGIAAALGAMAIQILDTTITVVALPYIQQDLGTSVAQVSWLMTAYMVGAAITMPMSGWLSRRFGRRNVLLTSLFGFAATSMWCGITRNLEILVFARLIQGVMGAPLMPLAQALIHDLSPPNTQKQAAARVGAVIMLAPVIGPTLGGLISEFSHWSWIFFINVPIAALASIGLLLAVPRDKVDEDPSLDFGGFLLFSIAMVGAQIALDRASVERWQSAPLVQGSAAIAIVSLVGYVLHHRARVAGRTLLRKNAVDRVPYLDNRLLDDRAYRHGLILSFVTGALLYGSMAMMPTLMTRFGYSALLIGLLMAPRGLASMFVMAFGSRRIAGIEIHKSFTIGLVGVVASLSLVGLLGYGGEGWLFLAIALVQGLAFAFLFVAVGVLPFLTVPLRLRSEGAGFNHLTRNMGGALGIAGCELVLAWSENGRGALAGTMQGSGYFQAFGLLIVVSGLCMVIVAVLKPGRPISLDSSPALAATE